MSAPAQEIPAADPAIRDRVLAQARRYTVDIVGGAHTSMLFAFFDKKVMRYAPPVAAFSPFIILREAANLIANNPNSPLATNPGDFVLYCVGRYHEVTGQISDELVRADPLKGQIGTLEDLIFHVAPPDVTEFLRAAVSHVEETQKQHSNNGH